jgi:putative membrane protein
MDLMPLGGLWLLFVVAMQLAVLALVVLGIVWLVRRLSVGEARGDGGARSALDELEMRYARGEIDRTTYLQMKDDLTRGGAG